MAARRGSDARTQAWSRREDLNAPSADYSSAALLLSYTGVKAVYFPWKPHRMSTPDRFSASPLFNILRPQSRQRTNIWRKHKLSSMGPSAEKVIGDP